MAKWNNIFLNFLVGCTYIFFCIKILGWIERGLVKTFSSRTKATLIWRSSLHSWNEECWIIFLLKSCLPSYPPSVRSLSEVLAPAMYARNEMKLGYCRYLWSDCSLWREKSAKEYKKQIIIIFTTDNYNMIHYYCALLLVLYNITIRIVFPFTVILFCSFKYYLKKELC